MDITGDFNKPWQGIYNFSIKLDTEGDLELSTRAIPQAKNVLRHMAFMAHSRGETYASRVISIGPGRATLSWTPFSSSIYITMPSTGAIDNEIIYIYVLRYVYYRPDTAPAGLYYAETHLDIFNSNGYLVTRSIVVEPASSANRVQTADSAVYHEATDSIYWSTIDWGSYPFSLYRSGAIQKLSVAGSKPLVDISSRVTKTIIYDTDLICISMALWGDTLKVNNSVYAGYLSTMSRGSYIETYSLPELTLIDSTLIHPQPIEDELDTYKGYMQAICFNDHIYAVSHNKEASLFPVYLEIYDITTDLLLSTTILDGYPNAAWVVIPSTAADTDYILVGESPRYNPTLGEAVNVIHVFNNSGVLLNTEMYSTEEGDSLCGISIQGDILVLSHISGFWLGEGGNFGIIRTVPHEIILKSIHRSYSANGDLLGVTFTKIRSIFYPTVYPDAPAGWSSHAGGDEVYGTVTSSKTLRGLI